MKYQSPIPYHSKDMANVHDVRVFADKHTDRRTGQKLYAPDLSIRGHKKVSAVHKCQYFFLFVSQSILQISSVKKSLVQSDMCS
jgi:hypothetical protein